MFKVLHSTANAQAWIRAHPDLTATILHQDSAVRLARDIFAPLPEDANPSTRHR